MAKDPLKYWKSDEVRDIADELIAQFHPHLAGESIIYLFRSQHAEENGKIVLGKAKRVSGLNAYLANRESLEEMNGPNDDPAVKVEAQPILLMEIAYDAWVTLNATQRIALVDHELCHFGKDGMRAHDVEEFREVIDRHGLWRPEIELLAATIAQQKLFPDESFARDDVRGLTPAQVMSLRQLAQTDARILMRITLDNKRPPTSDERARLETGAIESAGIGMDRLSPAHAFYTSEVERALSSEFAGFEAVKGQGSAIVDQLMVDLADPKSKVAKEFAKSLKKHGGSLTVSSPGRESVTLTADN